MDDLLERLGIKVPYEEMNTEERETYQQMLDVMSTSGISLPDLQGYLEKMLSSVQQDSASLLVNSTEDKIKDAYLKARIKNYSLLIAFLKSPQEAKKALEQMLTLQRSMKSMH